MIFRLAFRNIIGNGWRSLINVVIIALILLGMIFMEAYYNSWLIQAKTLQLDWEYASGMLRVKSYDPYDAFSWEKSHAPIPDNCKELIAKGEAVPVLFSPAVAYAGGSMIPVMAKGIPYDQSLLKFPSSKLGFAGSFNTPAIIGQNMAQSTKLSIGDIFTMRVKDAEGAFTTLDLEIVDVIRNPVPSMDDGIIWLDLGDLQDAKMMPGETTTIVSRDPRLSSMGSADYTYLTVDDLFYDLNEMMKTEDASKYLIYMLLMFLVAIAIFDTQTLALFKRRREIGTLSALGMTKGQIISLFTTEGIVYYLFGVVMAAILGMPFFWYLAVKGFYLPNTYDQFGIAGFTEVIYFSYPASIIFSVLAWVLLLVAISSWIPARKIAAMKPTDALRGR
jgi:ABC-type lipoprotein release transport system permease subunit